METKLANEKYCHECGQLINVKAEICPKCGVRQPMVAGMTPPAPGMGAAIGQGGRRSRGVAAVLALLLGGLGVHKFYLGKPIWGLVYLALCWTFVPAIIALIEGLRYAFMSQASFDAEYNGGAWIAG
ncbi:MAG: NINE protein [Comamonadaceae bacterium]|nr:MAG: NINE protein [Comamonadaceae bacterium]